MKLQEYSTSQVMQELNIKNETQVKIWSRGYKNGEILAYTIRLKQDTKFVLDTLNQFDWPKDVLLHSDQGSVYTSAEYYNLYKEKGIIRSMSRKGTPADNASIESFHSSLKCEAFYIKDEVITSSSIVIQIVENYIKYYNEKESNKNWPTCLR